MTASGTDQKKSRRAGPDGSRKTRSFGNSYLLTIFSTRSPMIGSLNISWL